MGYKTRSMNTPTYTVYMMMCYIMIVFFDGNKLGLGNEGLYEKELQSIAIRIMDMI